MSTPRPNTDQPTEAELYRWLSLSTGGALPLPVDLRAGTGRAKAALAAWVAMHRTHDKATALAELSRTLADASAEAAVRASRLRDVLIAILRASGDDW